MEKRKKWIRICVRVVSYVLVAAAASCATILLLGGNTKLAQLEQVIVSHFVGPFDRTEIEDAAARAMVNALGDRWSYYISAEDYAAYSERKDNSYVGIGITIVQREDGTGFDILSVEPDGPAGKAGILPGDVLIEADGQSVAGMDADGPAQIIRGEAGTKVQVVVLRQDTRLEFTVTRKKLDSVVATGQMLENGIGYVRIYNFNTNCADQTLSAIEDLLEQGVQKLIFDVRNNPGGYVAEMNEILDYLLPEGDLFRSVNYDGNEQVDTSDDRCLQLPMVVLVNGSSYSAAEFFAAALREYDWASIVGTPTVGKGYFQNTFRMTDGSAVGLSVGQYFTPNGVSLAEEGGLVPDVQVPVDEETDWLIYAGQLSPQEDPQVLSAMNVLQ